MSIAERIVMSRLTDKLIIAQILCRKQRVRRGTILFHNE